MRWGKSYSACPDHRHASFPDHVMRVSPQPHHLSPCQHASWNLSAPPGASSQTLTWAQPAGQLASCFSPVDRFLKLSSGDNGTLVIGFLVRKSELLLLSQLGNLYTEDQSSLSCKPHVYSVLMRAQAMCSEQGSGPVPVYSQRWLHSIVAKPVACILLVVEGKTLSGWHGVGWQPGCFGPIRPPPLA